MFTPSCTLAQPRPTWSINDELLGLGVVDGRGLHLDCVVAVAEFREAEASDVVEVVDAVEVPLVVPLRPQFQHCSAKQVELQTESGTSIIRFRIIDPVDCGR